MSRFLRRHFYFVLGIALNPQLNPQRWADFDDLYVMTCFRTRKCLLGTALIPLPVWDQFP